jgi:hypothetical protein
MALPLRWRLARERDSPAALVPTRASATLAAFGAGFSAYAETCERRAPSSEKEVAGG